jgi:hypothetical protein
MTQEYVPVALGWVWHRKVIGLSLSARGLWISGLCFGGTTDGHVTHAAAQSFAPGARLASVIAELIDADLWETEDGGWEIHDFSEHCAWLSQRRDRDRERQQRRRDNLRRSRDGSVSVTLEHRTKNVNVEHRTSPNGESSSRKRESDMTVSLTEFTEAWNGACDPLPRLRKPPAGSVKLGLVRQALTYFDGDLTLLAAAVGRAATDAHYRESGYGFEAFCRHVERWGNAPVASNASSRRDDKYADAPRFGPSPLAAAYIALDNAHTPEEKAAAKAAILEASK